MRKRTVVLIGAGDVAKRLADSAIAPHIRFLGLARSEESARALRDARIVPIRGDLDSRRSLQRIGALANSAFAILYLAPPPNTGVLDVRVIRFIAQTNQWGKSKFHCLNFPSQVKRAKHSKPSKRSARSRFVYMSTTGTYGDRSGAWVDETSSVQAGSARAKRRVAAEARARRARKAYASVLRVPGIYAAERLPITRLEERLPALQAAEDVFTNHIHADDLAKATWLAAFRGKPTRVYNITDDASLKMGEYFDAVADAFQLPRPPRVPRRELAQQVTPMMLSFMSESRRIRNVRMKRELRMRLKYPTPDALLRTLQR